MQSIQYSRIKQTQVPKHIHHCLKACARLTRVKFKINNFIQHE